MMGGLSRVVLSSLMYAFGSAAPLTVAAGALIRAPRVRERCVETGLHGPHRLRRTVAGERRAAAKRQAVRRERARQKARR